MKRWNGIIAIALATVIGVSAAGCGKKVSAEKADNKSEKEVTITAATGGDPKPYVFVDEKNNITGYDIEVLKAAFKKIDGYKLKIETTDFGSVFSGLNSGKYQIGVNNFSYNEERGKSYLYSYPYDKIGYVFVTKKGSTPITSFKEAAGKTTQGGTGVSITTAIEAWNEKNPNEAIDFSYTDSDTIVGLKKVESGELDFHIIDVAMFKAYQDEYHLDLQANEIPEDEAKLIADNLYAYYVLPKDQSELREKLDGALKELKVDGTLTKLGKKWFGQDTAPEDDKFEKTIN